MHFVSSLLWVLTILYSVRVAAQAVAPASNVPVGIGNTQSPSPAQRPGLYDLGQNTTLPRNFVRTFTPQFATTNPNATAFSLSAAAPNTVVTSDYFDGLGRKMQTVAHRPFSTTINSSHDLITVYTYDNEGRQTYSYVPYPRSVTSNADPFAGKLDDLPYTNLGIHYDATNTSSGNYKGEEAYTKTIYDNSPLNRVVSVESPGKSWTGSGRGTQIVYGTNPSTSWSHDELPKYTIGNSGINDAAISVDYYSPGELTVTTTTDEDGQKKSQYTDFTGKLIAVRSDDGSTWSGYPQNPYNSYHITQYIYDDFGRLRLVVPPQAMKNPTNLPDATIDEGLCYRYWYDSKGRLVERKLPGNNTEYFVYNKRDKQVLYKRAGSKWQFTIYDATDRIEATGIHNTLQDRSQLQNEMNNSNHFWSYPNNTLYWYLKDYGRMHGNVTYMYNGEMLTRNFYDHYNYAGTPLQNSSFISANAYMTGTGAPFAQMPAASTLTHGLLTGNAVRIINPNGSFGAWLTTVNFYDEKSRLIQQKSDNINGGQDVITTRYYFTGQIANRITDHSNPNASVPTHQHTISADRRDLHYKTGLEKAAHHRVEFGTSMLMREIGRDLTGKIRTKKMGDFLQSYSYNIRGWLTGINKEYVDAPAAGVYGPFFGERISYDKGFESKLYNGNIAGIEWRGSSNGPKQYYGYSYDLLNRITHAEYAKWESPAPAQSATWTKNKTDFTVSNISYDANGNLQSMKQRGPTYTSPTNATIIPGDMDVFQYSYYPGTNKLQAVTDNATSTPHGGMPDFRDGNTGAQDYQYDGAGNLTIDLNKGIGTAITYTHFNKPLRIVVGTTGVIEYTYDAAGNRLRKTVTYQNPSAPQEVWDYIGPFVYKNNLLQYVLTEEGRCRPDPQNPSKFIYDYFIKDHLQNVRSVVKTTATTVNGGGSGSSNNDPNLMVYLATMEVSAANTESLLWDKLNDVRDLNPNSLDPADQRSARLEGTDPDRQVGTAIMLRVMPGDKFDVSSRSYYEHSTGQADGVEPNTIANALLTTLAGGTVAGQTPVAELDENMQILQGAYGEAGQFADNLHELQQNADPDKPKSFLNYVLFDENLQVVHDKSGAIQATGDKAWAQHELSAPIEITQAGYLTVFTSSAAQDAVWWDQIMLTRYEGQVVEEDHYYPFGLTISSVSANANERNDIKFQSQPLQKELGLNWYSYKYREHDMQIGRFIQVDPLAESYVHNSTYAFSENKVTGHIELEGLEAVDINLMTRAFTTIATQPQSFEAKAWGFGLGVGGAVVGAAEAVMHPVQTLQGMVDMAGQSPAEMAVRRGVSMAQQYGYLPEGVRDAAVLGHLTTEVAVAVAPSLAAFKTSLPEINVGFRSGGETGLKLLNAPVIKEAPIKILPSSNAAGTSFVVDASGQAFPVPSGATGPTSLPNGKGVIYTGGRGGANRQVSTMRVMSPVPAKGKAPDYPNGYIKYENNGGQGVDPYSGRTLSRTAEHFPLQD